jgi:hypothetical protein
VDHVMIEDLDSGLLWFVEASGRAAVNCPPDGRLVELEPDEIKAFAPRILERVVKAGLSSPSSASEV